MCVDICIPIRAELYASALDDVVYHSTFCLDGDGGVIVAYLRTGAYIAVIAILTSLIAQLDGLLYQYLQSS